VTVQVVLARSVGRLATAPVEPEVLLQRRSNAPGRQPAAAQPNCREGTTTASATSSKANSGAIEAKHASRSASGIGQIVAQKAHVVLSGAAAVPPPDRQRWRGQAVVPQDVLGDVSSAWRNAPRGVRFPDTSGQRRPGCRNGRSAFPFCLSVGPIAHVSVPACHRVPKPARMAEGSKPVASLHLDGGFMVC